MNRRTYRYIEIELTQADHSLNDQAIARDPTAMNDAVDAIRTRNNPLLQLPPSDDPYCSPHLSVE